MKILLGLFKFLLFLLVFTFAIKNTDMVAVRYYLGMEWQAPLIFVMLAVFCIGAVVGVLASFTHVFRLRREIGKLKRELVARNNAAVRTDAHNLPDAV